MVTGLGLWFGLALRHLSVYRGSQAFYKLAQRQGGFGRTAAVAVLEGPLGQMARDYGRLQESIGQDRISPAAIEQYSDDSLAGYADETLEKGGKDLSRQQRGLILPLLERAVAELGSGASVVEIGTGNGDIIAHLAGQHGELEFTGVDLSVATAERKHGGRANLDFKKGYALELLEGGDLRSDLVFSSSTWVVFTPRELQAYLRALAAAGVGQVVLNEPTWAGHEQTDDSDTSSWHLEGAVWHHNYAGYLREAGYEVADFDFQPYRHPVSERPDIFVLLIRGRRSAGQRPSS